MSRDSEPRDIHILPCCIYFRYILESGMFVIQADTFEIDPPHSSCINIQKSDIVFTVTIFYELIIVTSPVYLSSSRLSSCFSFLSSLFPPTFTDSVCAGQIDGGANMTRHSSSPAEIVFAISIKVRFKKKTGDIKVTGHLSIHN